MPRLIHHPVYKQIELADVPLDDAALTGRVILVAPCVCGDSHKWDAAIPPAAWRLVTRIGEGGYTDD